MRTVKVKWVLNKKRSGKFKGRLVGRGDRQRAVTLSESYSPTMTYEVLRLLLAEAIHSRRYVLVLDVNAAYREIYIEVPEGEKLQFSPESISKDEIVVLKLNKALYGLVQSGRLWAIELGSFLVSIGFKEVVGVQCLYILEIGGEIEVACTIWVDDLAVSAKNEEAAIQFAEKLKCKYGADISEPDEIGYIDKLKAKVIGESAKVREYKTPLDPGFYFCPHENKTMINGKELAFKIKEYREIIVFWTNN
ncbi:unnamed protein product [Ambrosiozyma monospora]|uniref:Unnamed protein product n=1 Tax=Ambrosiozyma monospora TaxID=43982 RepID=A0ACB5SQY7_AMBMO|nr:unnamed protein product [Ambrosiozyma monospora]